MPVRLTLQWSAGLEIGIPEIDDDHRRLAEDSNELLAEVGVREASPRARQLILRMQADFLDHFRREESTLRAADYPEAERHAEEHRRIEQALAAVAADFDRTSDAGSLVDLAHLFRDTLIDHLVHYDMLFKSHLLGHRGNRE